MCWTISQLSKPEKYHHVAKEDIIVYKYGQVSDKAFYPRFFYEFSYKPNIANDAISLTVVRGMINEGYHSYHADCFYQCKERHLSIFNFNDYPFCFADYCDDSNFIVNVGEFIIPKGTDYYKNENGEIVSSNIMWNGKEALYIELHSCGLLKDIFP